MTQRATAWAHVRGILVAAHILAVIVLAIPDAGEAGTNRAVWNTPTVKGEFEAWAEKLRGYGFDVEADELEEDMWSAANGWTDGLATIRTPLQPYVEYAGVRQRWRMFVGPHRHPAILHVAVHEQGQWRAVYIPRRDEYAWRKDQFDHIRLRSALFRYGWPSHARDYGRLAVWIAHRAAEDFPEADYALIRLIEYRTQTPQEVEAGVERKHEFRQPIQFDLEALR